MALAQTTPSARPSVPPSENRSLGSSAAPSSTSPPNSTTTGPQDTLPPNPLKNNDPKLDSPSPTTDGPTNHPASGPTNHQDETQIASPPDRGRLESTSPQEPELQTPKQPIQAHSPQFGMNLEEIKKGNTTYQRRQWADMIRNDPQLLRLHRTGRLVWPGGIITALGSAWLMLSIAGDIDWGNRYRSRSATGTLVRYVFPLAMIGGGIPMVVFGARARIELNRRHVEMMAAPLSLNSSSGQGGGAMIMGRF